MSISWQKKKKKLYACGYKIYILPNDNISIFRRTVGSGVMSLFSVMGYSLSRCAVYTFMTPVADSLNIPKTRFPLTYTLNFLVNV